VRQRLLNGEERPLEVGVRELVEERLGEDVDGRELGDAGGSDQDVDLAQAPLGGPEQALQVGEAAHVPRDGDRRRAELGARRLQRRRIAAEEGHARPVGRELARDGQADAAVSAGDDRNLVLELHVRLLPIWTGATRIL